MIEYRTTLLIVALIVAIATLCVIWILDAKHEKGLPKKIKNTIKPPRIVKATYTRGVLRIEYADGEVKEYYGDCTVWHKLPMMERCSTLREGELCQIWKYIDHHGNPYPTAHRDKIDEI